MDTYVYPKSLKKNLKKLAPILIYAKGNLDLIKKNSVAIVGARKSEKVSLDFTDSIAKRAVNGGKVVVSGFAKGVDKQALDSALKYNGESIIVLPQGIETYKSKTYYKDIVKGKVLVISTYHPKANWSIGLAMDRNKTIYGLANDIYAAESSEKGGTWEGVLDGLKRGRTIYVRYPEKTEKNANLILISKGAVAVGFDGQRIKMEKVSVAQEPEQDYAKQPATSSHRLTDSEIVIAVESMLIDLKGKGVSSKEIVEKLNLDKSTATKLSKILEKSGLFVKRKKGRSNVYSLKNLLPKQQTIFN